jgi:hypothetical protein
MGFKSYFHVFTGILIDSLRTGKDGCGLDVILVINIVLIKKCLNIFNIFPRHD